MQLFSTLPNESPSLLWQLQQRILTAAEETLGPRDVSKKIYQPVFHEDGPRLRNTPNLDGAFIELSTNARTNWTAVVFEMAHETVHLLNPTVHYTNWLEEGVAVEFSLLVPQALDLPVNPPSLCAYAEALSLVRQLPGGALPAAKRVRDSFGSLGAPTMQDLRSLFAETDVLLLEKLAERCVPR